MASQLRGARPNGSEPSATTFSRAMATVSPCTKVCVIGADGLCDGCLRTPREIAVWGLIPDEVARRVMADLSRRRTDSDPEQVVEG